MKYTELTNKALKIAYNAHHGQLDKAGLPYIFHPLYLAEQMSDEVTICVALLHDVLEDTNVTIEELKKEFPDEIMTALQLLTRDKNTKYFDYIRKIKKNPVATKVKLADLEHNSDLTRFSGSKVEINSDSLRKRYSKAKEILMKT